MSAFSPSQLFKNKNFYVMIVGEAGLFALALISAYGLRFEFEIPDMFLGSMLEILPVAVVCKLVCFGAFGLYRGMWRYTGLSDLWRIGSAAILSECILVAYIALTTQFQGFPRSVFILDFLLTFLLASGARIFIRIAYEAMYPSSKAGVGHGSRYRALIVGADDIGARLAREMMGPGGNNFELAGFVDDDAVRIGRRIHGLPIYGPVSRLPHLIQEMAIDEVLINAAGSQGSQLREVITMCESARVRLKKMPALQDIVSGRVSIKALADVRYEDLLGRSEIHLDIPGIEEYLQDKVVLVTGAGGSIGSELCRQIVRFKPGLLVMVDAGEENLYSMEMELLHQIDFSSYRAVLGQVQDRVLMDAVFQQYQPAVVFHAAAYKHVPMLELNPWQAVTNNILGSQVVMELSVEYGVQRFVLVSTDKAVRPTNVMGASKRVAEKIMLGLTGGKTIFMAVRFGNVLGSSGSVIPLFRSQIERGGPVTVTDPEVTRYFMTIPEAAQLIVQAGAQGQGGEVFLLKMGQPIRIADLARDLILLSGRDPADIGIKFIGLRPGEKLYEELITEGEDVLETGHDLIMVLRSSEGAVQANFFKDIKTLIGLAERFQAEDIRCQLSNIVPEYAPNASSCVLH